MANIDNTGLKFYWVSSGNISSTDTGYDSSAIYFVKDRRILHVNGVEFGLSESEAASLSQIAGMQSSITTLETNVDGLQSTVSGLQSTVGDLNTLGSALVTIANDLKEQIDGGNYYPVGSQSHLDPQSTYDSRLESPSNVIDAINKVYAFAAEIDARSGISGLQGDSYITVGGDGSNKTLTFGGTAENLIIGAQAVGSSGSQGVYIDGSQSIYTGFQQVNTKLVEHDNKISGLQSTVVGLSGHQSTIETLSSTVNQNSQDISALQSGKVSISTNAVQQTNSGAQGSLMTTTEAIASAIESAYNKLVGDSNDVWSDDKTLEALKKLIDANTSNITGLQNTLSGLTENDLQGIQSAISAIKSELITGEQSGEYANTYIDAIITLLGDRTQYAEINGVQSWGYQVGNGGIQTTLANVIAAIEQDITTAKNEAINAGQQSGVTELNNGTGDLTLKGTQGVQVSNANANGEINISVDSNILLSDDLDEVEHGAQGKAGDSVQTVLNNINTEVGVVGAQAATAHDLAATVGVQAATAEGKAENAGAQAATAEGHAQDALSQLKWVVI